MLAWRRDGVPVADLIMAPMYSRPTLPLTTWVDSGDLSGWGFSVRVRVSLVIERTQFNGGIGTCLRHTFVAKKKLWETQTAYAACYYDAGLRVRFLASDLDFNFGLTSPSL